jgi:5-methylcytosine-specific restriction endonuclease McrA
MAIDKKRPKIRMLKPTIRMLESTIRKMPRARHRRLTGRRAVERRSRWLDAHPLCAHCQLETPPRVTAAAEVDHIMPLHQGGTDDESNFQSLCVEHHRIKTAKDSM